MKPIKHSKIFQIIYPLLIYFAIYQIGTSVLIEIFADKFGRLFCLLISALICLIPISYIYISSPKPKAMLIADRNGRFLIFIMPIIIVILGLALNFLIASSGFVKKSPGFLETNEVLNDGGFFIIFLCNCFVLPVLEEILIRGVIAGILYESLGLWQAAILSAFCFGIIHNNIVQFIYAFIMGILIALMYLKTGRLLLCIISHCMLNFAVIIIGLLL